MSSSSTRPATHAGSWYEDDGDVLSSQLDSWLSHVKKVTDEPVRAVISPHAGFSYSATTAAHAYAHLQPSSIQRVFILGPSHHFHTRVCQLSRFTSYATPLPSCPKLKLDVEVIKKLKESGMFEEMTRDTDEDEHSIEMQLPFIAHLFASASNSSFTVIPIVVGSLSPSSTQTFSRLLSPYFSSPSSLFVISSDFCHWGSRFSYTLYDKKEGEIWQSIAALDLRGMNKIEDVDGKGFWEYEKETENTICGRHPIGILLAMLEGLGGKEKWNIKFVKYAQSSQCKNKNDSSVSYASAIVTEKKAKEGETVINCSSSTNGDNGKGRR